MKRIIISDDRPVTPRKTPDEASLRMHARLREQYKNSEDLRYQLHSWVYNSKWDDE